MTIGATKIRALADGVRGEPPRVADGGSTENVSESEGECVAPEDDWEEEQAAALYEDMLGDTYDPEFEWQLCHDDEWTGDGGLDRVDWDRFDMNAPYYGI